MCSWWNSLWEMSPIWNMRQARHVIYTQGVNTWIILFLVLHDIDDLPTLTLLVRYHRVLREFVLVGRDGADAARVLVENFARRARSMEPGGHALQEPDRVRGRGTDQGSALALHLVPGTVRILQGHALATRQDPIAVAPMQPEGLHLAVGDHDQPAVLEAVAGLRRSHHLNTAHRHRRRERLDLLDYHRAHLQVSVRRFGVHRLDHLPVVRADEQHVVCLTAGCLHLGIHGDLRESVTAELRKIVSATGIGITLILLRLTLLRNNIHNKN